MKRKKKLDKAAEESVAAMEKDLDLDASITREEIYKTDRY